ncbi:MAG: hypothetical protein ACJ764_12700 [Solirubrobacteraceae bacterium]
MSAPAQLPYIDEHSREIAAPAEQVWHGLLMTMGRGLPSVPGWLAAAWGLEHATRRGDWHQTVSIGDAVPGFTVAEAEPARLLALRGRHRFSDYELRFELGDTAGGTRLRVITFADFPGHKGSLYRAAVIGTGGHRVAVRRLLAQVERRATSDPARATAA